MKKILTLAICSMIYLTNFAQAPGTITSVEGVFGGRINAITGGRVGTTVLSDTFRIFVATESANSIFYTYGHFPTFGTSTVDSFIALPSANATAGLGSSISKMAFHKNSQTLYFIASSNVYSTTVAATSATKLTATNNYTDIIVEGNNFYSLTTSGSDNTVYYSTINASTGALTAVSNTTISSQSYTSLVDGKDDKLYLFRSSNDPQALQFGGTFSTGINLASATTDAMTSLVNTNTWNCMGVYTDGTVFVGGTNGGTNPYKYVANTATFNTAYTTVATGINGTSGSNIEFREDGFFGNYYVYFGTAYSTAKGAASTWFLFGNAGIETHPNDGAVKFFDNNIANNGTLLLTTDAGLGITKNSGSIISDINNGILATQVEDFDMNSSKTFGWLAAKDGIRYVHNYNTTSKSWTTAFWPMGDGSPYYSAEMIGNDSNSVYVGNLRIYKTNDKGSTWNRMFTPENAPYSFPSVGVRAEAIAVSDSLNNIVMAGYYNQNTGQYGGVFYSMDGGTNWNQLLINATSFGQDVNVNDIEMTTDSGRVVAYIGIDYINSTVRGMYKAQWDGATWSVRREEIYGASTSQFSVTDIIIPSKDTIAAVGSFYNPVLGHSYPIYFNISRTVMNSWKSTVVDTTRQGAYTACAWNRDTIFYAYQNNIFYDIISFHSTSTSRVGEATYSTVDNGTEINVMYYDELLVGSSTGFRSLRGATKVYSEPINPSITINTPTTSICSGTSVNFTSSAINIGSSPVFQWYKNNSFVGSGSAITFQPGTLSNGDVINCILTTNNQSVNSNTIIMTVKQSPFVSSITGNLVSCSLGLANTLNNTTPNGVWGSSNNTVATISASGRITALSNGSTNINYTVTGSNGCTNIMSSVYKVSTQDVPSNITGTTSICVGTATTLTSTTIGGAWSSMNNRGTINASGTFTGVNAGAGEVRYTVTNADGCSAYIATNITVNAIPGIPSIAYASGTANPQTGAPSGSYCVGKVFNVVGSPTGGSWSATGVTSVTGVGTVTINAVGTGTLKYTYTNSAGCSNSRTINGNGFSCAAKALISNNQFTSNDFSIYPNPAKRFINLKNNTTIDGGNIVITDLYGKTIRTQTLSLGTNTIDISNLSKGMYFLSMITGEGKITKKLVVE